MAGLVAAKNAAREAALVRRAEAHRRGGHAGHLSAVLAGYRGVPVAGYAAMRTEIDPRAALEEASAHGVVGLPVIMAPDTALQFRLWEPDCAMIAGTFGAPVPETGDWMTPQIVIVPLVAFDAKGGRLGYGGGFYDRTLELLRQQGPVLAIGFAYADQEVDNLPTEATDQPLDMIVTETGVLQIC